MLKILCGLLYVYRENAKVYTAFLHETESVEMCHTDEGTPILASALQTKHLIVFLHSQDRMQEAKIGAPVWVTEMQRN